MFKKLLCLLCENGQQVGSVTRKFLSIDKNPVVFNMSFQMEREANFNLLLLFLICLILLWIEGYFRSAYAHHSYGQPSLLNHGFF